MPPLGEFALASILYFAKDLRRMIRSQEAGRWEQFDITDNQLKQIEDEGLDKEWPPLTEAIPEAV